MIRTDTACGRESVGGPPTSTTKPRRCVADVSDGAVTAPDQFLRVASTNTAGCVAGAKLFVGLEMVTMTICDAPPAIGAAVSRRAIPVRETLNEMSCGGRVSTGGRILAETAIALLTLCAGATAGMAMSTMTIAETERVRCIVAVINH